MKIFISSTAYDLGDIRAIAIERIRTAGHVPLHHELPTFAKRRGLHSHDMCIQAVDDADAVLCVVDRRYGGTYGGAMPHLFPPQRVDIRGQKRNGTAEHITFMVPTNRLSITWCELIRAYDLGKQVITFARSRTLDEKQTRRRNQFVKSFAPAYADRNEVFDFLDWITKRPVDNWIVPFNSAVDFDEKLRVWLDELGGASAGPSGAGPTGGMLAGPATSPIRPAGAIRPVTVVVEGPTDRAVVTGLVNALELGVRVDTVVAGGKLAVMRDAGRFLEAFHASAAIVFLIDADTNSEDTIAATRQQFAERIHQRPHPAAFVCFAVPQIEAWMLAATDPVAFERRQGVESSAGWKAGLNLQLATSALASNWQMVMQRVPSFRDFIETLRRASELALEQQ